MADTMKLLGINIENLRDRIPNLEACIEKRKTHIQALNNEVAPEREVELQDAMLVKMNSCKNFAQSLLEGFAVMWLCDLTDATGARRLTPAKIAQMNKILAQLIVMCTVTHKEWDRKIADARKRLEADPDACIWSEIFGCAIGAVIKSLIEGACTLATAITLLGEVAASFMIPEKTDVVTGAVLGGVIGGSAAAVSGGVSLATVGGGVLIGAGGGILAVCIGYAAYGFYKGSVATYRYCTSPNAKESCDKDAESELRASEYAAMLKRIKSDLPAIDLNQVYKQLTALMGSM